MAPPAPMDKDITIRPVRPADVEQVVQLARAVMKEIVVDILRDQLCFLARHPWPYVIVAICFTISVLFSEGGLLQWLVMGLLIAGLEEVLRFAFFVSRWLDIFYKADDIPDVINTFSGKDREFLVAVCGGRVVGTVGLSEQEGGRPSVGHLTRFFIHSSWRGKGLGSRLLEASTASLRRMGYTSVELLTHHTNTSALNFYKKRGFRLFKVIHYASVYPYVYDQYELVINFE